MVPAFLEGPAVSKFPIGMILAAHPVKQPVFYLPLYGKLPTKVVQFDGPSGSGLCLLIHQVQITDWEAFFVPKSQRIPENKTFLESSLEEFLATGLMLQNSIPLPETIYQTTSIVQLEAIRIFGHLQRVSHSIIFNVLYGKILDSQVIPKFGLDEFNKIFGVVGIFKNLILELLHPRILVRALNNPPIPDSELLQPGLKIIDLLVPLSGNVEN
jgi:hypothetical protein